MLKGLHLRAENIQSSRKLKPFDHSHLRQFVNWLLKLYEVDRSYLAKKNHIQSIDSDSSISKIVGSGASLENGH